MGSAKGEEKQPFKFYVNRRHRRNDNRLSRRDRAGWASENLFGAMSAFGLIPR